MKVLQLDDRARSATNVWVLGDLRTREAIAIDTATPSVRWLTQQLGDEGWDLRMIISTHRHWDHIGDNAEAVIATGATLAAHIADRHGLEQPDAMSAPFPIPPSVPALDLQEGSRIRFGDIDLTVLHTPGHTEGSVCLLSQRRARAALGRHALRRRLGPHRPARRQLRRPWSSRSRGWPRSRTA